MSRHGDQTRLRLVRTAEVLFAERGVERVSLREVATAAGEKNHSAANYHFGDKAGLVDAILERHSFPIQELFDSGLDALEARGDHTLRDVIDVLTRPIAEKLHDPDNGRHYLAICAQLAVSPVLPLEERGTTAKSASSLRIGAAMAPFLPVKTPALHALRITRLVGAMYVGILQYERINAVSEAKVSWDVFVDDLIDCLTGLLSMPPTPRRSPL